MLLVWIVLRLETSRCSSNLSQIYFGVYEKKKISVSLCSLFYVPYFYSSSNCRSCKNYTFSKQMKHQLQPYKLLCAIAPSLKFTEDTASGSKKCICSLWHFVVWLLWKSWLGSWLFLMAIAVAAISVKYPTVALRCICGINCSMNNFSVIH